MQPDDTWPERAIVVDWKNIQDKKKERRREPPLRCRVLELRLRKTADPPRPFQLHPVPQYSAPGPQSRITYLRLIYRRLSAFQLPQAFARLRCQLPEPELLPPGGSSGSRLPDPGPPATEAAFGPDLRQPELPSIFQPVEACASWRLSQGIASPFRVTL